MNTFKLTMPNGIIIESTWSNSEAVASTARGLSLPKASYDHGHDDQAAVCRSFADDGNGNCIECGHRHGPKGRKVKAAAPVAPKVPAKAKTVPAKPSKKATPKKAAKQPTNGKALLAEIRSLKAAGKYSEAVALTPASWLQVIGEIQLHAERHNGNGAQFNAAVPAAKAAKKAASKKRKASKKPAAAKVVEAAPVQGALEMAADTGSIKQAPLAAPVEAAVNAKASLRDQLTDIGVDGFANDLLCGDIAIKACRTLYTTASEDEVLVLMEACKQEALCIEDAAERLEAAGLTTQLEIANQLVELWKFFAAKLNTSAELMTSAA